MSLEFNPNFNLPCPKLQSNPEPSVMHADFLFNDLDASRFLLPGLNPASNEFEIGILATEMQAAESELVMLDETASDFHFFPDMSQEGWSVNRLNPDVLRSSSCPPLPFSSKFKVDRKVITKTVYGNIYSCSICPKTFKKKYGLDSHMTTHSSVRSYKCSMCPDSFKRANDLRRHARGCAKKLARRGSIY
jgi:DNA-directed RNA polymerase subunit RPC12/RpoP